MLLNLSHPSIVDSAPFKTGAPMSEAITIQDLAEPVLSKIQQDALAFTNTMEVNLAVGNILADAERKTGLSDFGSRDFVRRLQLLCDEWGGDRGLTNLARLTLCNKLVLFARNRLLITDLLKQHPEIHDVEISRPVIVCGLPRSGTTHLLNLLASDRRLSSLPLWESYEPVPLPGEAADYHNPANDPRYKRCLKQWNNTLQMTPLLAAMHPMNPEHIHEEIELMGPDFASYNFEWLSHSPRWRDDYYQHDQTPHYEYMKTVLKVIAWQRNRQNCQGARWVLKCPQHLEQLPVLKKVFPDATVVVTHRDPVAVIQSTITMLAYGQRINRKSVMMHELLEYWSARTERLLGACVRDRSLFSDASSIDVPFDSFMKDNMAIIHRIYDKASLEMTPAIERSLLNYIQDHPRGKQGQVHYRLKEDFGVDPMVLRERFRFYFDAFPVKAE